MLNSGCTSSFAKWICLSLALALALLSASPARAQVSGATLSGLITDENGGPVPDANVAVKNLGTGVIRELKTNADGFYSAPNLIPGSYEVRVTAKGFQTLVQKEITLTVGAQQALNLSLKVGQLNQTVEVNAAPPDVQTTSSTISATVDSITVRQLPLNGRDWTSLATLEPGAARHPDHRFEWTRAQFRAWAAGVADRYGYRARFLPVGPEDPRDGPPTQLAVFSKAAEKGAAPWT